MRGGTAATVRFPAARASFRGDTRENLKRGSQHRQTRTSGDEVESTRILKFVSRAEHLAWRERWKNGRWVKLSWTPEERNAILRQDETYRQADARWQMNHGPVPRGADVVRFSRELSQRATWTGRGGR